MEAAKFTTGGGDLLLLGGSDIVILIATLLNIIAAMKTRAMANHTAPLVMLMLIVLLEPHNLGVGIILQE
jgi:hypothetical protein